MTRIPLPRSFIILAAGAFVGVALGCSGNSEAAQQLARADTLARAGKYPEVLAATNQVLARDARDPKANRLAGFAYLETGQFAQAYDRLLRGQARTPDNPQLLADLARLYLVVGKTQEAHDVAVATLARDSANVTAAVVLAATASTQRDVDDGLRRLRSVESRFGDDPTPRLALARLQQRQSAPHAPGPQPQQAGAPQAGVGAVSYLLSGQRDLARAVLNRQLDQNASDAAARRLLAELALVGDSAPLAEKLIMPVLAVDSTDVEALILRGRAYMVQDKLNEAVRDLRHAQSAAPRLAPVYYYLGAAFARLGRGEAAKAVLDSAIDMTGNYPEAVTDLSIIHIQNDIARASISDAERQVRINRWSLSARRTLGDVLAAAGRNDEAAETLREAVKLAPDRAEPHYWLGVALVRDSAKAQAVQEFETALRILPDYSEPLAELVRLDLAAGDKDAALRRATSQAALVPRSGVIQTLLGKVYAARNDDAGAEAAYLKAIQLEPRLLEPHVQLAEAAIRNNKLDVALSHAQAAREIDPKNARALVALGFAYQLKNDIPNARRAYEQVLAVDSTYVPAANNLALLLSESNTDQGEALKWAGIALRGAPNDPYIKDTAGWVLFKAGHFGNALQILKESATSVPNNAEFQYHLGMAAQKTGDVNTAKQALQKAVTSPANFRGKDEARKALALLK